MDARIWSVVGLPSERSQRISQPLAVRAARGRRGGARASCSPSRGIAAIDFADPGVDTNANIGGVPPPREQDSDLGDGGNVGRNITTNTEI
eukprot:5511777-Pyramimonas_sp.AAC.1